MKKKLKRIIVIFIMKGCNLLNITLLILYASCTSENADFKKFYSYLISHYKNYSANWTNWESLFVGTICFSMSIFGGLYIYRNGWRSLVPQSWRKTQQ